MTRFTRRLTAPAVLGLSLLAAACGNDDDGNDGAGDAELITRVTLTLTATGLPAQTVSITDPDGLGPLPPEAPTAPIVLVPGTTYNGTVTFTNTTTDPFVDITEEVEAEGDEHRVFYTVASATGVTAEVTDTDVNGAPLGLAFRLVAANDANGPTATLRVLLSHYDGEPKGNGSTPSTETDVDVTFGVIVAAID